MDIITVAIGRHTYQRIQERAYSAPSASVPDPPALIEDLNTHCSTGGFMVPDTRTGAWRLYLAKLAAVFILVQDSQDHRRYTTKTFHYSRPPKPIPYSFPARINWTLADSLRSDCEDDGPSGSAREDPVVS